MKSMEWMYGLPLFNFLMEFSEPYKSICSIKDEKLAENWTKINDCFSLMDVRKKLGQNSQLR